VPHPMDGTVSDPTSVESVVMIEDGLDGDADVADGTKASDVDEPPARRSRAALR